MSLLGEVRGDRLDLRASLGVAAAPGDGDRHLVALVACEVGRNADRNVVLRGLDDLSRPLEPLTIPPEAEPREGIVRRV